MRLIRNTRIILLAIVLGVIVQAYTVGYNPGGDPYLNVGRLIGGSIAWAVLIGIVLLFITSIVRRFFRKSSELK